MADSARSVLGAMLALVLLALPASAAERVALVFGNGEYAGIADLPKAVGDARAMAGVLRDLGFEVIISENAPAREMRDRIGTFISRIAPGDDGVLFFTGHGLEWEGRNYLIPTDIAVTGSTPPDFDFAGAIDLGGVLERAAGRDPRAVVAILGASHPSPFPAPCTRCAFSRNGGYGRIEAPRGTAVVYAAGYGEFSLDRIGEADDAPTSSFVRNLVSLIARPGLSLSDVFRQVREAVANAAAAVGRRQLPAYMDELDTEFYFAEPPRPGPRAP